MSHRRDVRVATVAAALVALLAAACESRPAQETSAAQPEAPAPASKDSGRGTLTLAFAGDVHFEGRLARLPGLPKARLGPLSRHLRQADLAMVNLESALAGPGRRTSKELERPERRYWFRTPPAALGMFERSGVDVVTVANNHGADYGAAGLRETIAADEDSSVAVVGVGRDAEEAFAPHRVTVEGTKVAVLAADASFRESKDPMWAAGSGGPGIASARRDPPRRLVAAVEDAADTDDVVVVYLHWGRAQQACPSLQQRRLAETLATAGADVLVGSHSHVLQGAGMLGDTYVAYGLGDFAWYHGSRPRTGVLEVEIRDGQVVGDELVPGLIPRGGGRPREVKSADRAQARAAWRELRRCAGLEPVTAEQTGGDDLPPFEAEVREIDRELRRRLRHSHDPRRCPVSLGELRHLRLSHVDFDGRHRKGELVVHADHAEDVVGVFAELYAARFPIRRMRLVDDYRGDDNRSMAAGNTSAYNCRRVAGTRTWSAHAFGAAIDINPIRNPYVLDGEVRPRRGGRFAALDRSRGSDVPAGVIRQGGVVTRAFDRIGWTWGADFADPDYQHFSAR